MRRDGGIILVNVLVALALGAALVVLMFTSQDNLIDRTRRAAASGQAEALAMGGEASVVAALHRDMIETPDTDNFTENWALIQQAPVALSTGQFSVRIADAQALFDVNQLADGGLLPAQTLALLVAQAGLPPTVARAILRQVQQDGPLTDLADLQDVDPANRGLLSKVLTALPVKGDVNLNTAPLPVLTVLLGNPAVAARLLAVRDRQGFVTSDDVAALALVSTAGVGLTSDVYDVTVMAEVDDASVTLTSRILRLHRTPQEAEVRVISRRFGPVEQPVR